ncbi:cupredoxin domain-containing protein [Arthrobacter sp. 35/47]|uniref:cupredoxin domain-containing protein n=1 Tax=Arthrobacter sp. 35/47 TaxID=269454 RepID=UPI0004B4B07A|nr:cupredoxin domain-containing protein [Arthrobacter sp. 35/47]
MNIPRSALGLVLAAALAGLAGCGSDGEPTSEAPPAETSAAETTAAEPEATTEETASGAASEEPTEEAPAEEIVITIVNFEYEMPDSVPAGAEITVVNEDTAPHTVTTTETEDFDAIVGGGETTTFTAPSEPGDYPFICTYHPNMTGTLTVSSDG